MVTVYKDWNKYDYVFSGKKSGITIDPSSEVIKLFKSKSTEK